MPPREIYIVRHGERLDKKNPGFSKSTVRPHDPPLTDDGVRMAEALGQYLRDEKKLATADVVVLSSPLVRCVQTASGIARGLQSGTSPAAPVTGPDSVALADDLRPRPPVFIEPCLVESLRWQFIDLQRNPAVAHAGHLQVPDPLWRPIAFLQEKVSSHVHSKRPYSFPTAPVVQVVGDKLTEEDFEHRCRTAAEALGCASSDSVFDGKTVICVSHGEASMVWCDCLSRDPAKLDSHKNPSYTSFMLLRPEGDAPVKWVLQLPAFSTPHLPEEPSEY